MQQNQIDRRRFLAGLGAGTGLALAGCAPRAGSLATASASTSQSWGTTQAFLESYIARKPLPGALAAVGHGMDAPTYIGAGTTTGSATNPVGADTLWRIYSMTKPVTGIAAMLLVDDGNLTLDQDIGEILPEWASPTVLTDPANSLDASPAAGPITIRHLLTHTAGLGYSIIPPQRLQAAIIGAGLLGGIVSRNPEINLAMAQGATVGEQPTSIAEFSERAAQLPLLAEPGTVWSYSMSLEILSRVIEVVAGMPFEQFLRTRLFSPLGMNNTFFQVPADKQGRMTDNHGENEGNIFVIDPADSIYLDEPPIAYGGGGLVSSARDYDRFLMMLLGMGAIGNTRVMREETARLAMSDLMPEGVDKSRMYAPSGFGAGGAVATGIATGGTEGQPRGSFGWGGAAGTAAWVDFENNMRISGYIQLMGPPNNDFRPGFTRAVYADIRSQG